MDEIKEEILIPKSRVETLKRGKRFLERLGNSRIHVSKDGEVTITSSDALDIYITKKTVTAVARGFTCSAAQKIFKEGNDYEQINLQDYAKSKNSMLRIKGRVIGQQGKSKNLLERYTNTQIEVFGKTIGIIGEYESVVLARRAIEMLLTGAQHATVYKFIQDQLKLRDG